jgi:TolB-like protein
MKNRVILLFFLAGIANPLFAANVMTLAVMDLQSEGVSSIVVNAISDIVRTEFVNIANFRVVERNQMDKVFEEQKLQLSGLTEESSAVKIGEILSAQKVVIGEVNLIENAYVITLRIVDVETAESEFSARVRADSMDDIEDRAVEIARDLAQRIVSGNKEYFTAVSPRGYYLRSILPGWGQFYAEKEIEGFVFSAVSLAALGLTGYATVNYLQQKDAYNELSPGAEQSSFDASFADLEDASQLLNIALITLGSAYIVHWIDVLFFARPDFSGQVVNPQPQTLSFPSLYIGPYFTGDQYPYPGWAIIFRVSR